MTNQEKKMLLQELYSQHISEVEIYYKVLEDIGDLKYDYISYMTDGPINCEMELERLPNADYTLCCALLTMLIREDYFCNGSFEERYEEGRAVKYG